MARKPKAQFNMRISETLLHKLAVAAKRHDRTLTAEVIARLEASFVESSIEALVNATTKMMAHHLTEDLMQKMQGLVMKIVMAEVEKMREQSNV